MFTLAGILSQKIGYRFLLILNAYLKNSNIQVITEEVIFRYVFLYTLFEGQYKNSTILNNTDLVYIDNIISTIEKSGLFKNSNILFGENVEYINELFSIFERPGIYQLEHINYSNIFEYVEKVSHLLFINGRLTVETINPHIVSEYDNIPPGLDNTYNNLVLSHNPLTFFPLQDDIAVQGYTVNLSSTNVNTTSSGNGRNNKFFSSGTYTLFEPIVKGAKQSIRLGNNQGGYFKVWAPISTTNYTYSIECWFRPIVENLMNQSLIGCDVSLTGARVFFSINLTTLNTTNKTIAIDANTFNTPNFNYPWEAGKVYHLVFTGDYYTCSLYVNGNLIGIAPINENFAQWFYSNGTNLNFNWYIGGGYDIPGRPANSYFSHVATYAYQLTSAQVLEHYTAGKIQNTPSVSEYRDIEVQLLNLLTPKLLYSPRDLTLKNIANTTAHSLNFSNYSAIVQNSGFIQDFPYSFNLSNTGFNPLTANEREIPQIFNIGGNISFFMYIELPEVIPDAYTNFFLIRSGTNPEQYDFCIQLQKSNLAFYVMMGNSATPTYAYVNNGNATTILNKTNLIIYRRSGNTHSLFVNNNSVLTQTFTPSAITATQQTWQFGSNTGITYQCFGFCDYAITDAQISTLKHLLPTGFNINDAPLSVSNISKFIWLDSNNADSLLLNSNTCNVIEDLSGAHNHFVQYTYSNRPTLVTDSYGKKTLFYNRNNIHSLSSSLNIVLTKTAFTIYIVVMVNPISISEDTYILTIFNNTANIATDRMLQLRYRGDLSRQIQVQHFGEVVNSVESNVSISGAANSNGVWKLIKIEVKQNNYILFKENELVATSVPITFSPKSVTQARIQLGAQNPSSTNNLNGYISEFIVLDYIPSSTVDTTIRSYLGSKYSILTEPLPTPPACSYNTLINSHNPLIFFPLGINYQAQVNKKVICYAYSSESIPEFSFAGTINTNTGSEIVKNAGSPIIFQQNTWININKSISSKFNIYQNKTLEVWFKHKSGYNVYFSDNYDEDSNVQFELCANTIIVPYDTPNRVVFQTFNGAWSAIVCPTVLSIDSIYHVVVLISTSTVSIYINGVLSITSNFTLFSSSTGTIHIGRPFFSGHATTYPNNSPTYGAAIYDRLLTETEITEHYNIGKLS